ncbi:hypothetical protein TNCV_106181 [Trichonephila clavipes]|nr:hypothetical protein TNCV_106181 [Trichonephila clavipes]
MDGRLDTPPLISSDWFSRSSELVGGEGGGLGKSGPVLRRLGESHMACRRKKQKQLADCRKDREKEEQSFVPHRLGAFSSRHRQQRPNVIADSEPRPGTVSGDYKEALQMEWFGIFVPLRTLNSLPYLLPVLSAISRQKKKKKIFVLIPVASRATGPEVGSRKAAPIPFVSTTAPSLPRGRVGRMIRTNSS